MTTNNPEVKRYDCTSGGAQHCYGCYTMKECELGDYVVWEAYEALQAECEKWKRGSEIRDEQNQDLHAFIMELKAECERLVEALEEGFPLLNDEGLDEVEHHCEYVIQRERKRVHSILAAHRSG